MTIYTIGHSTRSLDAFIALLTAHGVNRLADIRTVPRSRRHPHFSIDALPSGAASAGILYRHFPGLGGLRKARADSTNTAWRHAGFRGYADYMQTPAFESAIDELLEWSRDGGGTACVALMCAEAVWWQCHRQLTADALLARGVDVRHIMSPSSAPAHALTSFARVDGGRVSYPGLL